MDQEERKVVLDLNRDISIQSAACSKNCRSVVFAIMAATWGFLLSEDSSICKLFLSLNLLIGMSYMVLETLRYYKVSVKAKDLYKSAKELSDEQIEREMTNQTDWAFSILFIQLWLCITLVLGLAIYVTYRYIL